MNEAKPRVGRPPGPHDATLAKVLPVALRLFLDEGGGSLTPTRLHQETGIARATIYRNWPDPADLIEILLARATEPPPPDLFTGAVLDDLHRAAQLLVDRFNNRSVRALFAACIEYGRTSARVAAAAEGFVAGMLEPFRLVMAAAVEAGVLDGDEGELVSEVAGPLVLEHVVMGRPVTRERGRAVVDSFARHHHLGRS